MFGLNKLFKAKEPAPPELESWLQQYRSDTFPAGLLPYCTLTKVSQSPERLELTLVMPFAAQSERLAIEAYLSDKLSKDVVVSVEVHLAATARFKAVKHLVLVASGKGGVGKSTTAINLAYALKEEGGRVGVLDADIYGPSVPLLMGLQGEKPQAKDEKTLLPMEKDGIKAQSIGFLVDPEDATVWRGPMASQALSQLLFETDWGDLDYLIVDMPPGTGDIQLTMSQKVPASGAVIVTTPQDLALADAQKGIAMFNKVQMPVLGLIENMSHFVCSHCGELSPVFGQHGGVKLAERHGVPLLGEIPLDIGVREAGERGESPSSDVNNPLGEAYRRAARLLASTLYYQTAQQSPVEITITDD